MIKQIIYQELVPKLFKFLVASAFLLFAFYFVHQNFSRYKALTQEIELYSELNQTVADSLSLVELQSQLQRVRRIRHQSSRAELTADFLDSMDVKSTLCNITISNVDFDESLQRGNIKTWSWQITYEASYTNHHCLVEQLENMDVAVRIDNVRLKAAEKQQVLQESPVLSVVLKIHVLLPAKEGV
jgi:Tfp pilus assembly protein PilO